MVPRENLTKGRWGETLDLFREIPESTVPEYHPGDPDGPIFDGEQGSFEVVIHGNTWYFDVSYLKDASLPEKAWPVPRGMGLVSASNFWDKGGPFVDSEDEYILVGGAVMSGLGGDFANYSNELNNLEVETYTEFLDCNYNTILLSHRVLEDVGMDDMGRYGRVLDHGGFIQLSSDESKEPFGPQLWNLLKSVDYLRTESEMSRPPTLDEDAVGVTMRRHYNSNEKQISERERKEKKVQSRVLFDKEFEEKYGTVLDLEELEAWATEKADQAIAGDIEAYKELKEMRLTYSCCNIRLEKTIVHRQMVRYSWEIHGGVNHYSIEETESLARDLMELGQDGEAAWLFIKIWNSLPADFKPHRTETLRRMAITLYRSKRYDDAEKAMQEYIALANPRDNFMDVTTAKFLFNLANIHLRRGEVEEAAQVMERSSPYAMFLQNGFEYILCRYMGMRARVEMARGNLSKAEDLATRGVNYVWAAYHVGAEDVAYNQYILAKVLYKKGDKAGAAESRRVADDIIRLGNKEDYLKEKGITPDDVLEIRKKKV